MYILQLLFYLWPANDLDDDDDDVVLRHTLPVFTGLGRCPIEQTILHSDINFCGCKIIYRFYRPNVINLRTNMIRAAANVHLGMPKSIVI